MKRLKYNFRLVGFGKYELVTEEIKSPREDGFYWVEYLGAWEIAEWSNGKWIFLGDIGFYNDSHFGNIYEQIIQEPNF